MDHWDSAKAHLSYQGLILLNEHIAPVLPPSNAVAENTVVYLTGEDGDHRYRLEKRSYKFFADEGWTWMAILDACSLARK